jgi:hypothetical protein
VNTSILEQELAPLNAQIEQVRQKRETLEGELRVVEAELQTFSADRQRFDALLDVCNALDKLEELKAGDLFWEGIPENGHVSGHVKRVRSRIASFEDEISGILEKQASYQEQISKCLDELDFLEEEVRNAYDREERRKEEFIIEREISPVPYRAMIMPWSRDVESEGNFRRAVLVALLRFVFGALIPVINVPIPDRSATVVEIPKRLVKLVKKDLPKPAPKRKTEPIQEKEDPQKPKEEAKPKPEQKQKVDEKPKVADTKKTKVADSGSGKAAAREKAGKLGDGGSVKAAARKKARNVGVLAFKDAFADLMEETPVAKVGVEARLSNTSRQVKGQAVAKRSLVAMQAKDGSSGGIVNARVSRNIGNSNVDRLGGGGTGDGTGGGAGFVRVESAIADLEESSRPLSDGVAAGRTDEEIQIVFDRYKAALYRIYNKELRKDPTLRGKILMRITIEPSGAVSMCKVESTDLASPELVEKIVERVKRFNFGPKEGVLKITILYPIDFLPAG